MSCSQCVVSRWISYRQSLARHSIGCSRAPWTPLLQPMFASACLSHRRASSLTMASQALILKKKQEPTVAQVLIIVLVATCVTARIVQRLSQQTAWMCWSQDEMPRQAHQLTTVVPQKQTKRLSVSVTRKRIDSR